MFLPIPYRDENETIRTPVCTFLLIAINVLVWLFVQGAGKALPLDRSICLQGLIPAELMGFAQRGDFSYVGEGARCLLNPERRAPEHLLTSMFLHGGWGHLAGNMWFLWLFGNNVEDSMGRRRFLLFYVLSGFVAALAHVLSDTTSTIPMVGASGAISGVMGAYIVLYPKVRVYCFVWLVVIVTSISVPAWVMLGCWLALQLAGEFFGGAAANGGVAFWAHIGGFVAGVALVKLFARPEYIAEHRARHWRPSRMGLRPSRF
ncbi:MAG: hypothetical protein RL701_7882 [Pseudomonadota bacterium]